MTSSPCSSLRATVSRLDHNVHRRTTGTKPYQGALTRSTSRYGSKLSLSITYSLGDRGTRTPRGRHEQRRRKRRRESGCAAQAGPDELREFVKERVAAYKYPRHIWILDELPKGPTGKLLRREITVPAIESTRSP